MPTLFRAHPPRRRLLIVTIAMACVITLAMLVFAWPASRLRPRELPVGLVGSSAAGQQLIERLSQAQPGGFEFRLYPDESSARTGIQHREVYGAFLVTGARIELLEASAAGPAVARELTGIATKLVDEQSRPAASRRQQPTSVSITDVVPTSPHDPNGAVLSSALLPLTICSILIAAAIGVAVSFRPAWRQLAALTTVAAVAGFGAYLIAQPFLGALPHGRVSDWATLALTMLAVSAPTTGLIALIGAGGLAIAAALMVFVGNPFSAATSAPELLPGVANHLGQWLPPGAGVNLLRSAAYFDGHGGGGHLGVLLSWVVVGFAAIVLGHHGPIPFAARSRAEQPGADAAPAALEGPVEVQPMSADRRDDTEPPRHLLRSEPAIGSARAQ